MPSTYCDTRSVCDLFHIFCIQRPRWGFLSRRNIVIPFRMKNLDWSVYPTIKKALMICLAVSTEYRRMTDGRTE